LFLRLTHKLVFKIYVLQAKVHGFAREIFLIQFKAKTFYRKKKFDLKKTI